MIPDTLINTRKGMGALLRCLIAAAGFAAASLTANAANLLQNPDLALDANGGVAGWRLNPKTTQVEKEATDLPAGVAAGLCLTVAEVSGSSGELTQKVVPRAGGKYVLTGYVKSEKPRGGYLEIKLYKSGRELKRYSSPPSGINWQRVTLEVSTEQTDKSGAVVVADKIEVLCRWYQQEKHNGGRVWFADLRFEKIENTVAVIGGSEAAAYASADRKYGWAQMLGEFAPSGVSIENRASYEVDAVSFIGSKAWSGLVSSKPSMVLIQFSENDFGGQESDLILRRYVRDAKAAGMTPVLLTPPCGRYFEADGSLMRLAEGYSEGVIRLAKEERVMVIDLHALSAARLGSLGVDGSLSLFCSVKDRSHFSKEGARLMAAMVVESLVKQHPELQSVLNLNAAKAVIGTAS